ncbi:neuromedin-U receptor 2 [Bicyclus anynana]|uniref:Neuromedin-U receptor 2 n=1 Tax=Bicyclus anynana TaxID=110368 RepID=A0A6J1MRC5_BICAN|nr:neuromedin-U receptor 2 [Bicyclus anynana]
MTSANKTVHGENNTYASYGIGLSFYDYDDKSSFEESFLIKTILSVFLTTFMVLSLIGNICTCTVITREKSMRTPTNCYLLNLAITDLMVTIFVPVEIYIIWVPDFYPLGEQGCRIHFLLWDLLSSCSVLTILAFTIERYLVIAKPFLRQKLLLTSRVFKIIIVNWVVSSIFSVPSVYYVYFVERKENVYCFLTVPDKEKTYLVAVELFIFYGIPMTVIFGMYVMIAIKLKSNKAASRPSVVYGKQNRNKAVKMLAAVAAFFFICWSPYTVLRIMILIPSLRYQDHYNLWRVFIYLSSINSYMSAAVNPILYGLMSRRFRRAFKDLLQGKKIPNRNTSNGTSLQITSYRTCDVITT